MLEGFYLKNDPYRYLQGKGTILEGFCPRNELMLERSFPKTDLYLCPHGSSPVSGRSCLKDGLYLSLQGKTPMAQGGHREWLGLRRSTNVSGFAGMRRC